MPTAFFVTLFADALDTAMNARDAAPASSEAETLEVRVCARSRCAAMAMDLSCPGFGVGLTLRLQRWEAVLEAELRRRKVASVAATPGAAEQTGRDAKPFTLDKTAGPPTPPHLAASEQDPTSAVNKLREQGNSRMRAGDPAGAAELYSEALRPKSTGAVA